MIIAVLDIAIVAVVLIVLVGVHIVVPLVMVQHDGVSSNSTRNSRVKSVIIDVHGQRAWWSTVLLVQVLGRNHSRRSKANASQITNRRS